MRARTTSRRAMISSPSIIITGPASRGRATRIACGISTRHRAGRSRTRSRCTPLYTSSSVVSIDWQLHSLGFARLREVGRRAHVAAASCDGQQHSERQRRTGPVDVNVLALGVLGRGELREDPEGVGAKVVALGLQQALRQALGAVAVEEGQRGREGGPERSAGSKQRRRTSAGPTARPAR